MTAQAKRSPRFEKLARIYDAEIAPCWGTRFGRLLLRDLAVPARSQVLDVSCGTGEPTLEILRRMTEGSRLIAIDESSAMLDVVRRKVAALGPLAGRGVFFRTESAVPKLSFADEVYDLVVCNLGVHDMPSSETALRDFARVAKPGGEVRVTLPLAGTFAEFHDLYREVLVKHDKHDALDRLEHHVASYPEVERAEAWLGDAGLTGRVEVEEFSLLFRSSRELFLAPVIEYGPLAGWKAIAGDGQEMQDVFWYIKEAIDAYFGDRPFQVKVVAGCIVGHKPRPRAPSEPPPPPVRVPTEPLVDPRPEPPADPDRWSSDRLSRDSMGDGQITAPVPLAELDGGLPWPPDDLAIGSVRTDELDDIEELASGEFALDEDSIAEQDLDALIAGRKRPQHLRH
ncbi:MAG TPA: methyltransferase domain-containing protein [Kofleriaceae bacterium]